ncbi:MAG: Hsp20/alpha crystallin family protein [Gemmataceae bacterium]|nr:Hsp20/alpha crystallin family protein [Gemmataceae bacterium]
MFGLMPRRRERPAEGALARRESTPFDLLRHEFASLFDRAFPDWPVLFEGPWEMVTEPWGLEMEEGEKEVVVRAEMPGFEPNEIEVTLRGNLLTIRAEHREPGEGEAAERRHARLERTVTLPTGIVPESIEARCRNGVLEVHVPRAPEVLPRRIEVKT